MNLKTISLAFLLPALIMLAPASLSAQQKMAPPEITITLEPPDFSGNDTLTVIAGITLDKGWHVNSTRPESEFLIPTVLTLTGNGLAFGIPVFPQPVKKFVPVLDQEVSMFEGGFEVRTKMWKSAPHGDIRSLKAVFSYQACSDEICLRPASVTWAQTAAETPSKQVLKDLSDESKSGALPDEGRGLGNLDGPLLLVIFLLIGGGLLLNLTPCVYPLIAVTISIFGSQGNRSFQGRLFMSILYVLGIMISFSALGVLSAFSGKLFGSALQSPAAQIVIALVFVILALSSFGLFEIRLPAGLMGKAMNASNTGGYIGGLLGGLFAGILASPCIGPFILALIIFVAEKGSLFTGVWMFATLALGMGLPYLILGMTSGLIQKMPKSGDWMADVKKLLGIVLLALANYYLRGFTGETGYALIFGVLLMYAGIFVNPLGKFPNTTRWLAAVIKTAALAAILTGASFS